MEDSTKNREAIVAEMAAERIKHNSAEIYKKSTEERELLKALKAQHKAASRGK